MEVNSIKDAFDRVSKKQKVSSSKSQENIEQINQEIQQALSGIQAATNSEHNLILNELKAKLKEIAPLGQQETTQKELNVAFSKYIKLLEKNSNPDISKAYKNVDFDLHTVNQIVASHFYLEGLFDIGDSFVNECHEESIVERKTQFLEMYKILESMKSHDLGSAIKWATANHENLQNNGSDIELKLHRLQFFEILQHGRTEKALKYIQTHISPFGDQHLPVIQKLMGCLVYFKKLNSSPYSHLLSPNQWAKLAHELVQQLCIIVGESYKSPLGVTIAAGLQRVTNPFKTS